MGIKRTALEATAIMAEAAERRAAAEASATQEALLLREQEARQAEAEARLEAERVAVQAQKEKEARRMQTERAALKEQARAESLTPKEKAHETWDNDPALQAEFKTFDIYWAFRQAEAKGQTRIVGGRTIK